MNTEDWKSKLTPEQQKVMLEKGTETPFSGKYVEHFEDGVYKCVACGNELFKSDTKYESTTPGLIGWPSFSDSLNDKSVELKEDSSYGMSRTEVVCSNCKSHLGHLFEGDPDSPNGKHYCINSVCLDFKPGDK
jgi:peptide-methionine (R)-S-oxide reductase